MVHQAGSVEQIARLAGELSSPVRVQVLLHLIQDGPARVRELAIALGTSDSLLSNHLSRMRQAGLVSVSRSGRSATYRVAPPHTQEALAALAAAATGTLAGGDAAGTAGSSGPDPALVHARSCYDHLAGELGVTVYDSLLQRQAIELGDGDDVHLGPNAEPVLISLGVGMTSIPTTRRRLGFSCVDWTQGRHHLGGAIGAALLSSLLDRGWLTPVDGSRALTVTAAGDRALTSAL